MTNKQSALVGNILTTLTFLISAFTTLSVNLSSADAVVATAFTIGVFIGLGITLTLRIFTWVAYVMIGKVNDKGWKIFLLVIGILGGISAGLTILSGLMVGMEGMNILLTLSQVAGSIFFILAFAIKPKDTTISNSK
ncbi:hypothetical protein RyT2_04060 [Pseudolactococcus yaeyamensis]